VTGREHEARAARIAKLLKSTRSVDDEANPSERYAHVMGSERIYDHRTVHTTPTPSPDPCYGDDWTLMASYDLDTGERIGP
jgi:hypothetical protein